MGEGANLTLTFSPCMLDVVTSASLLAAAVTSGVDEVLVCMCVRVTVREKEELDSGDKGHREDAEEDTDEDNDSEDRTARDDGDAEVMLGAGKAEVLARALTLALARAQVVILARGDAKGESKLWNDFIIGSSSFLYIHLSFVLDVTISMSVRPHSLDTGLSQCGREGREQDIDGA